MKSEDAGEVAIFNAKRCFRRGMEVLPHKSPRLLFTMLKLSLSSSNPAHVTTLAAKPDDYNIVSQHFLYPLR